MISALNPQKMAPVSIPTKKRFTSAIVPSSQFVAMEAGRQRPCGTAVKWEGVTKPVKHTIYCDGQTSRVANPSKLVESRLCNDGLEKKHQRVDRVAKTGPVRTRAVAGFHG